MGRHPQRNPLWQPGRRKQELEVQQAARILPAGRAFLILKAVVDVMGRAEVEVLGQR